MTLTGLLSPNSTYEMYFSEFYPGGLRGCQFCDLHIISLWGNMKMLTILHKPIKTTQFFLDQGHSPYM